MSDELENKVENLKALKGFMEWWAAAGVERRRDWAADAFEELQKFRARPQEPGLSKEWLDELLLPIQRELYLATFKMIPQESIDWQCGFDAGSMQLAKAMIDAMLSAPSAPLSDPQWKISETVTEGDGESLNYERNREPSYETLAANLVFRNAENQRLTRELEQLRGPLSDRNEEGNIVDENRMIHIDVPLRTMQYAKVLEACPDWTKMAEWCAQKLSESRGPLSDEPRGNQEVAAPSVGELENFEIDALAVAAASDFQRMSAAMKEIVESAGELEWSGDEETGQMAAYGRGNVWQIIGFPFFTDGETFRLTTAAHLGHGTADEMKALAQRIENSLSGGAE